MNHSTWKGSHYESGLRYGATLYERRINLMEHLTVDRARLDYAQAAIPVYRRYFSGNTGRDPGNCRGAEDGAGSDGRISLSMYSFAVGNHCSCLAYSDGGDGAVRAQQRFSHRGGAVLRQPTVPAGGGRTDLWGPPRPGQEMEDGVNEHGLAAGLTFMYPTKIAPGFNAGMLVRYVLERCRTVGGGH